MTEEAKYVAVKWYDSSCEDGILSEDGIKSLSLFTVTTIGHLVLKDDLRIIICMESFLLGDGANRYRHTVVIPRLSVVDIKKLGNYHDVVDSC